LIAAARFARALARGDDPSSVFELGCVAVETRRFAQRDAESGGNLGRGNAPAFADLDLAALADDAQRCEALSRIAVDALMLARYRGEWTPAKVDAWRRAYERHLSGKAFFEGFFKAAGGCYAIGQGAPFSFAVARTMAADSQIVADDPVSRFRRDLNVVGHVAQSLARRELEPLIVKDMRSGWSDVLSNQRFRLRLPVRNCPAMETAVADLDKDGLRAAARLLLAAAPAVDEALTPNWEQMLRRIGRLN
jgi:hypothetical protein